MTHALFLTLLLACGGAEAPHGHEHGDHSHDGKGAHSHGDDHAHDAAPAEGDHAHDADHAQHDRVEEPSIPMQAKLGDGTLRVEPAADALRVVITDAAGAPVPASGEARVVLTGEGEDEQRLVLAADGEAWVGAAKAAGAKSYTAVVSVEVDGVTQVARVTWAE